MQEFVQVDAFADRPFCGNPAAVLVMDAPADAAWMQAVASEMNLSETAFCHSLPGMEKGNVGEWELRWFTPTVEVDLCGHATLATAHVLATEHGAEGEMGFHTRSGRLSAIVEDDTIRLDFPVDVIESCEVGTAMSDAVGTRVLAAAKGATDLLVEVGGAAEVRSCNPDMAGIAGLAPRGVIVTAACDDRDDMDVVSRFFAPRTGIPEDPVTGSAHTTLAAWWASRIGNAFRAEQASARGGEIGVQLVDDRVHLSGRAVTVVHGKLLA